MENIRIQLNYNKENNSKNADTIKTALSFLNLLGRKKTIFVSTLIVNCLNENGCLDASKISAEEAKEFANNIIMQRKKGNFTFDFSNTLTAMAIQGLAEQFLQNNKEKEEESTSDRNGLFEKRTNVYNESKEISSSQENTIKESFIDNDMDVFDEELDDDDELTDEDMKLLDNIAYFKQP